MSLIAEIIGEILKVFLEFFTKEYDVPDTSISVSRDRDRAQRLRDRVHSHKNADRSSG